MYKKILFASCIALASQSATASTLFSNGFETDTAGWVTAPTRVASGTGGVPSASGSFHATTTAGAGEFTRWGGYNFGAGSVPTTFQEYWTSVDIFLDVGTASANNTRFDFSSAISNSSGLFLQDFIFNGGFYDDATGPGAGTDRFVISASNNSQPGSAFAKNPAKAPISISTTGWYTFEHHFYENAGFLNVDMSIFDSGNALINDWTLTSSAIAGVGGNRYGWFDYNEFPSLAIDNSELRVASPAAVPESGATLALLGLGLAGVFAFAPKKRAVVA